KGDAEVEQGAPPCHAYLALRQPCQPVVARPGVQEIAVQCQTFAESAQEAARQTGLAEGGANGEQLMTAITRVLLPFPAHAVHAGFLSAIDRCVQRGVE